MTKKTKLIILLSVLLLLIAVVGCTLQWFFSPGIHRLLGFTHVEYLEEGYLYQDGKILGPATLEIKATGEIYSNSGERNFDLTLRFGDLHPTNCSNSDNLHSIIVNKDNNLRNHDISITGGKTDYEHNGDQAIPVNTSIHYCHTYLDENDEVLLSIYYPELKTDGYFFVKTSDPQQAQALLDEIFGK